MNINMAELWPDGAVRTSDMKCEGSCGFMGGYSGFCSACWRKLDGVSKVAATERQKLDQPSRTEAREARARDEMEAEKKRHREQEEEKHKNEEEVAHFKVRRRESKQCEPLFDTLRTGADGMLEEWTCGVGGRHMPVGAPLNDEPDHKHDEAQLKLLSEASREISSLLKNYGDNSSESGDKWKGFFICVPENPLLAHLRSPKDIIESVFGNRKQQFEGSDELVFSHDLSIKASMFPQYDEMDGKTKKVFQRAGALLKKMAGGRNTGFSAYPGKGEYFADNIFVGCVTERGDLFGVRCGLVWS